MSLNSIYWYALILTAETRLTFSCFSSRSLVKILHFINKIYGQFPNQRCTTMRVDIFDLKILCYFEVVYLNSFHASGICVPAYFRFVKIVEQSK